MSRYQKGKTNLDFTEASDNEWQWHLLGHMQVCTLLQTDDHTSTPPLFFTGRMPFLPPNQQRQSTEGNNHGPSIGQKSCEVARQGLTGKFAGKFADTCQVAEGYVARQAGKHDPRIVRSFVFLL